MGARDANVHENAVDLRNAKFRKFFFHFGKRRVHDRKTGIVDRSGRPDRFRVAVKGNEARIRGDARQNGAAVPAAAEGGVNENAVARAADFVGRFSQEYGTVKRLRIGHFDHVCLPSSVKTESRRRQLQTRLPQPLLRAWQDAWRPRARSVRPCRQGPLPFRDLREYAGRQESARGLPCQP